MIFSNQHALNKVHLTNTIQNFFEIILYEAFEDCAPSVKFEPKTTNTIATQNYIVSAKERSALHTACSVLCNVT